MGLEKTMVGIDLGTTNSGIAFFDGHRVQVIPNRHGKLLTPSAVAVDSDNQIYVGDEAIELLKKNPVCGATYFKRHMGTKKQYRFGAHRFLAEELAGLLVKQLMRDAERFLSKRIDEVIVTVPAYFNDIQRRSTRAAADLAGVKTRRVINEPTAAALAGNFPEDLEGTYLVFDLGGGTFDVSIVECFFGIVKVRSSWGDTLLGGLDFDRAILNEFLREQEMKLDNLGKDEEALLASAREIRHQLSRNQAGHAVFPIGSREIAWQLSIHRFEHVVRDLLRRIEQPIQLALSDADLEIDELDGFFLAGGATKMPLIQKLASRIFRRFPLARDQDLMVVRGAGLACGLIQKSKTLSEKVLTDVSPFSLGIDVSRSLSATMHKSGYFLPIIHRNTPIPVSREEVITTLHDQQTVLNVGIFQGEGRKVDDNIKLGQLKIDVPAAPAGEQCVRVRISYDINGLIEVELTNDKGEKEDLTLAHQQNVLTNEEIALSKAKLAKLKVHPEDRNETKLLLRFANETFRQTKGELRDALDQLIFDFEKQLAAQDDAAIQEASQALQKFLEALHD